MLILIASARANGNTAAAVERLRFRFDPSEATLIDLTASQLRPFSYGGTERDDGFRAVVDQMIGHRHMVFATPVYWYAMSGPMKMFFDRLSDLLKDSESRLIGRAGG